MKENQTSFSHFVNNISRYRKRYGIVVALKAFRHYAFRLMKKSTINYSNDNILTINGCKLRTIPNDPGISSELLTFKTHEPITTLLVSKLLKKGMKCLDIGSNIGYYASLESQAVGSKGEVIAIEPSPQNFEYLKKNLEMQDFKNTRTFNFAASDKDGKIKFLMYKTSNECLTIPDGEEAKFPGKVIEVPCRTIDSFVEEEGLDKIDFLRMDVEGFEYYIFRGMKNTLSKHKPDIQMEFHTKLIGTENLKKLLQMLIDLDYTAKSFIPRDLDVPLIGSLNDVKQYDLFTLLKMQEKNLLPSFFMVILSAK